MKFQSNIHTKSLNFSESNVIEYASLVWKTCFYHFVKDLVQKFSLFRYLLE